MKFRHSLILIALFATLFVSCFDESEDDGQNDQLGNWVTKAYYGGIERSDGTCFEINGFGYYGMGRDKDNDYITDMWKYDPSNDSWTQVASFPGTPRAYNFSAANDSKGYVGTGYDEKYDLTDFWEYDPVADKWSQLADFPGGKRRKATAFSIGTAIYAGTGYNGLDKTYFNDFYKYDNGVWEVMKQFPGDKREGANTCVMDGKAYLISGHHSRMLNDFWKFDPDSNAWTRFEFLDDVEEGGLPGINRAYGNAFSVEGKIYLFGGSTNGAASSTIFEWNPQTLEWMQKTSLETGYARMGAGCFVINDIPYIVGGQSGNSPYADCYVFQPSVEKEEDDNY